MDDAAFGECVVFEELIGDVLADGDDASDALGAECFGFEVEEGELFGGEEDGDAFEELGEEAFSHGDVLAERFADGAAAGLECGGGDGECHGE